MIKIAGSFIAGMISFAEKLSVEVRKEISKTHN